MRSVADTINDTIMRDMRFAVDLVSIKIKFFQAQVEAKIITKEVGNAVITELERLKSSFIGHAQRVTNQHFEEEMK